MLFTKKPYAVFLASLISTVTIGYFDYITGAHISMMLIFSVPILFSSWYCGRAEGLFIAVVAAACFLIVKVIDKSPVDSDTILSWNTFTRLGIFCLIAYSVSIQAQLRHALKRERLRADTDKLTGMLNKGAFRERVEEEIKRSRRYNHSLSLAFIDLDNFKLVNDTEGHARGDMLLKHVSETITDSIRKTDFAGRVGGDEFTICFPETDEKNIRNAIDKFVKNLDIMTSKAGWQITASVGVVTCMEMCETYEELLGIADKLMYVAKAKGKNFAEFLSI